MSDLTEIAILLAWSMSGGRAAVQICVLVSQEQSRTFRALDLVSIALNIMVVIGLWPLAWGDA